MPSNKLRLDHLVKKLHPELSKTVIASKIMQGHVLVNDVPATKAGMLVAEDAPIRIKDINQKFVCRAGFKIEHALNTFVIDVANFVVLDAGLSTGGFTDCVLQRGAQRVYGVDVGYGQVHERISSDARVVVMERTNLRHLERLPELVDLVTLDLSFISVLKIIEAVSKLMKPHGKLVVLIKPQFEAGKEQVGKGGIVRDPAVHQEVIDRVTTGIGNYGFELQGVTPSPIEGTTGNKEFLAYFIKSS